MPTNWGREPGKPTSYPGWRGRIEFEIYPHDCGIYGSDVARALGIYTGTGGGVGSGRSGYETILFADDWPGLAEHVVMAKLSDEPVIGFKYGTPYYFKS
jgi:hypothetical protein